ncbi:MAG TPA: FAD-binding oxidoreductase, partial [Phycisphaerae bacterium]|nr:FAD-binding oxidoreductase [Phycisphaerae bacterium]
PVDGGVELENGQRIECRIAVNAAGPWAGGLGVTAVIKKRKGHLVITDRYPGYVHHQIVELGYLKSAHSVSSDSVAFNIQPRKTGQMRIGSSRQYDAEGMEVDTKILARMIKRAQEYLPDVGTLQAIRVWTGHRPATPDKLPLIGKSIESEKIYLATGHEGLGITTSLGTGRLVADLILGRKTGIDAAPYSPARKQKEGAHG